MAQHSTACCNFPPVIAEDYESRGSYIELNGTKTYVTGPSSARTAILSVYDIFGFFPQTIQGADLLAYGSKDEPYQVYMPDFFNGNPASIEWYPPNTEDKKTNLMTWFETAVWDKHIHKLPELIDAAEQINGNIKSWGIIGYCWGGKMAALSCGKDTKFKAAVQTSPARIDPKDAEKVTVPMMVLASEEETNDDMVKFEESLKVTKHVEYFRDQVHGWMSARADLKDPHIKAQYERGYQLALKFFHDNIH